MWPSVVLGGAMRGGLAGASEELTICGERSVSAGNPQAGTKAGI